jgi:hypothetical protein
MGSYDSLNSNLIENLKPSSHKDFGGYFKVSPEIFYIFAEI